MLEPPYEVCWANTVLCNFLVLIYISVQKEVNVIVFSIILTNLIFKACPNLYNLVVYFLYFYKNEKKNIF